MTIRLHIGCGPRILEGWTNIDLSFASTDTVDGNSDSMTTCVVSDVTKGLPYEDATVACIYSEDFIEHLNQKEQVNFLAECYRVLVHGGYCRVTAPDLNYTLAHFDLANVWDHGHKSIPTARYLSDIARHVGLMPFINCCNGSRCAEMPEDLRPHPPRPGYGNLFFDLLKDHE